MKIALDAPGGDYGMAPNIEGALSAVAAFPDLEVILVGDEAALRKELQARGAQNNKSLSIHHAPDVVGMEAEPVQECREKPNSSIVVAAGLVGKGQADAVVSAGNSGAAMVASLFKIGRIRGIARPAIAVPLPSLKGFTLLLDGGANTEGKPQHLLQFAMMGSIYYRLVFKMDRPTVGVLSVGEEETKGNDLVKETIPLLKASGLNYIGPVEGRDIPFGTAQVVVCDGYTGNIVLKLSEGMAKAMFQLIKEEIEKSLIYKIGALLSKPAFKAVKVRTDPDTAGGAPLLGIDGVSIISHGKSGGHAMHNALRTAREMVLSRTVDMIRQEITKMNLNAADDTEAAGRQP